MTWENWNPEGNRAERDREREDVERARKQDETRALEKALRDGYEDARKAASRCRAAHTPLLAILQRDAVAYAIAAGVEIEWLYPNSRAATMTTGEYYRRRRMALCQPIVDAETYVIALHEVAHSKDARRPSTTAERETECWRRVLAHTKVWDDTTHGTVRRCLSTYLQGSDIAPIDIVRGERFLAEEVGTARGRFPTTAELDAMEQRLFVERFGRKECRARLMCGGRSHVSATALINSTYCCDECAPLVEARDLIRRQDGAHVYFRGGQVEIAQVEKGRTLRAPSLEPDDTRPINRRAAEAWRAAAAARIPDAVRAAGQEEPMQDVETGTDETRAGRFEVAVARAKLSPALGMADALAGLAGGTLKCKLCGGPAVRVHRADGKDIGCCNRADCRKSAELDRLMRPLKRDRARARR
jgi:hypothetical protein